jgi:hypothetical protein
MRAMMAGERAKDGPGVRWCLDAMLAVNLVRRSSKARNGPGTVLTNRAFGVCALTSSSLLWTNEMIGSVHIWPNA